VAIYLPDGLLSQKEMVVSPGKAIGIAMAMFMIIIFAAVSTALLPKMSSSGASIGPAMQLNALRTDGNSTESAKGLAAMAKGNKEMTEVMRQQVNSEANGLIQNCLDNPDACKDLSLLQEICSSNNLLQLPSCSDPRLKELLAGSG
jgi:hypothetical protein